MENQEPINETGAHENTTDPKSVELKTDKKSGLMVPIMIIVVIIFLLFILIKVPDDEKNTSLSLGTADQTETVEQAQQKLDEAKNATNIPDQKLVATDHTQGNTNARVIIFEYSDLDCPYCVRFHSTMKQLIKKYPNDVLWVYRHFPLDDLHPKARIESIASECVASIGGNDAFWKFVDNAFAFTSSDVNDPVPTLTTFAKTVGVDEKAFQTCLIKSEFKKLVEDQQNLGIKSGARGTPFSVVVDRKTGAMYPAPGAQDVETMSEIVETILKD